MTSPFANLYISIMQRLQDQVPELRYIEQDFGQLEHYEIKPAVSFPCCLIDVGESFTFENQSGNIQFATGNIGLRLGLVRYSDSNNLVPTPVREAALRYFELEHKIYKALHNWQPQGFSKLLRIQASTEKREDDIRVRIIPFSISFTDDTASDGKRFTVKRPSLELGVDVDIDLTTP